MFRTIFRSITFDKFGQNLFNLYGVTLAVSCNYYIYDDAIKHDKNNKNKITK